jgi:hypothetical protein
MSVRRTTDDASMVPCIVVAIVVSWFTIQVVDLAIQVLL